MGLIKIIKFEINLFKVKRLIRLSKSLSSCSPLILQEALFFKMDELFTEKSASLPKMRNPPSPPERKKYDEAKSRVKNLGLLQVANSFWPAVWPDWDSYSLEKRIQIKTELQNQIRFSICEQNIEIKTSLD